IQATLPSGVRPGEVTTRTGCFRDQAMSTEFSPVIQRQSASWKTVIGKRAGDRFANDLRGAIGHRYEQETHRAALDQGDYGGAMSVVGQCIAFPVAETGLPLDDRRAHLDWYAVGNEVSACAA